MICLILISLSFVSFGLLDTNDWGALSLVSAESFGASGEATHTDFRPELISQGNSGAAEQFNSNLLELNKKYYKIPPFFFPKRGKVRRELVEVAEERRGAMIELARENPILFFNNVITDEEKRKFPGRLQSLIEEEVVIEGDLLTLHIDDFSDPNNPISKFEYSIIKDNQRLDFYPVRPLGFLPQTTIKTSGYQIDNTIVGFVEEIKIREERIDRSITGKAIQREPIQRIPLCIDNDGDGYGSNCLSGLDCNDANSNINPGATEVCNNNLDDDCDGQVDEGCVKRIIAVEKTPISIKPTPVPIKPIEPLKPITKTTTCIDSDGGINYDVQGTITVDGRTEVDSCNQDGTLREWFCGTPDDPLRSENFVSCSEGSCIDGVCSEEHKMAVILVDFLDSNSSPFTPSEAHNLIFDGEFQNFYQEQSYNRIHFTGDVFGWFTLPRNSDPPSCFASIGWGGELNSYIINNNIDLSNYDHLAIISNGLGCVGGYSFIRSIPLQIGNQTYNLSVAWVFGGSNILDSGAPSGSLVTLSFLSAVLIHEMGHSLGVLHANGYDCDDQSLDIFANCQHLEYGNAFDRMGGRGYSQHFNAFYKELLGWILPQETLTITQSGTYTINTLEMLGGKKSAKIKMLTPSLPGGIFQAKTSTSNLRPPYYLEYRKAIGFDSELNNPDLVSNQNGLLVNKIFNSPTGGGFVGNMFSPSILDMDSTSLNWNQDLENASLSGSNIFYDPRTGITISSIISTADSITFDVNLQQTTCIREDTIITMYSNNIYDFVAGSQDNMMWFYFYNEDYPICGLSNFNLSIIFPSGFSVAPSYVPPTSFSFLPEQTYWDASFFNIASYTPTGTYDILITVENLNSGLTTTETVSVNVQGIDHPPTIATSEL